MGGGVPPVGFYRVYKIPLSGSTGPSPGPKQPRRGPERPGEGSPGEARKTRRDPERARKHPDKRPERRPDSTPTQTRIRRMLISHNQGYTDEQIEQGEYGTVPERLLSDQGSNFVADAMRALYDMLGEASAVARHCKDLGAWWCRRRQ